MGAFRNARCSTYRAVVTRRGYDYYLGSFATKEEATAASTGFVASFDLLVPSARRQARGPYRKRHTVEERFWALVDKQPGDGCWLWTGRLNEKGYGQFDISHGQTIKAHHFLHGKPPAGLESDHTCHSSDLDCPPGPCHHRRCVRHIEHITHAENLQRRRLQDIRS